MNSRTTAAERSWNPLTRSSLLRAAAVVAMLGASGIAQAKDAAETSILDVDGDGFPTLVTHNGAGLTPGTYAVGTIMVDYFVTGFQFPSDWQGGFRICIDTRTISTRQATEYPANVYVRQSGASPLSVAGVPATIAFSAVGDDPDPATGAKCVDVDVSIPASVAGNPEFQEDGTVLVANLQESTDPGEHLDTPTTVKARVTLVHPTACVRAVHLVANNDFTIDLGVAGIAMSINKSNRRLAASPVDLQHLLALVNTCSSAQTVDVTAAINPNFDVFHSNGIRTTSLGQEVADAGELLGQGLEWDDLDELNPAEMCLLNVAIPAHQSFVFTQRVRVNDGGEFPGTYATTIERNLGEWSYGGFSYAMNGSEGDSTACPLYGFADDDGEVAVPVNQVTVNGSGGGTEYAP